MPPSLGDSSRTVDRPSPEPDRALDADRGNALADRLVEEMITAWRQGRRPLADEYLARHPELWHFPEAAVRIVYEEFCLRQEQGEHPAAVDIVNRFPQWQAELEVLLDCHRLMQATHPVFPQVGETLGDFQLLAELGRGALGRVFLANQPTLADRPVALKVTPRSGQEHFSLARLQHTHIVPLFSMQDFPERNLRLLCMPYLGGAPLSRILELLAKDPLALRTGQKLLEALDRAQAEAPFSLPCQGPVREFLAKETYVRAVCAIGSLLADALEYAHERGLVHLDLKPSNILLAADGQPMLLDFHLARSPVSPEGPPGEWLGGTVDYMSPEQQAALLAIRRGRKIPTLVDRRSDIYSLGLVLYEALAGRVPARSQLPPPPLNRRNPQVSVGLADIVGKCLQPVPRDRYLSSGALASDLRRHLSNSSLKGVPNRSFTESWRKWRRRSPAVLWVICFIAAMLLAAGNGCVYFLEQNEAARSALQDGREQIKREDFEGARQTFQRGLQTVERVHFIPGKKALGDELKAELFSAQKKHALQILHRTAERLRFDFDYLAPDKLKSLDHQCRTIWQDRERVLDLSEARLTADEEKRFRSDFLDLVIFWTDIHVRGAAQDQVRSARKEALAILSQAEGISGPSMSLHLEQQKHAKALGSKDAVDPGKGLSSRFSPGTSGEHFALGRFLLRSGRFSQALDKLNRAVQLEPQGFWPNFYQGLCLYQLGRFREAVEAFRVCVSLSPNQPECFNSRGRAYLAQEKWEAALADFNRALQLQPDFADSALHRGILFLKRKDYQKAKADFGRALAGGADPATVRHNLGLVDRAQKK